MKRFLVPGSIAGVLAFFTLAISACSTTPERVPELELARSTVQQLEREPMAQQAASEKLTRAREALIRAESALEDGESLTVVNHEAYVARRQAEIGLQLTSEAEAIAAQGKAESERNELRLQARTVEAEQAKTLAERRAAQAERSAREAEASRSMAQAAIDEADRLASQMKEMEAERTERGVVLTLGDVLFDTGQATLKEGATVAIDRLAEFMADNPERRLLIEGHTDSRGSEIYNRGLAMERASAVAEALMSRGIDSERLRPVGIGEAYPVASNDTPAGRQQNRRVEIVVSDGKGSFPQSAERRTTASR